MVVFSIGFDSLIAGGASAALAISFWEFKKGKFCYKNIVVLSFVYLVGIGLLLIFNELVYRA
ncbi:hypothetical protein MASR1M46_08310 [Bacteroidales bacterium]